MIIFTMGDNFLNLIFTKHGIALQYMLVSMVGI